MSAVGIDFGFQGAARPAQRRSHLRMTARGRAVLLTLIATPLVVAALAFGINAGSANGTTRILAT
jgi:hypothetical protein